MPGDLFSAGEFRRFPRSLSLCGRRRFNRPICLVCDLLSPLPGGGTTTGEAGGRRLATRPGIAGRGWARAVCRPRRPPGVARTHPRARPEAASFGAARLGRACGSGPRRGARFDGTAGGADREDPLLRSRPSSRPPPGTRPASADALRRGVAPPGRRRAGETGTVRPMRGTVGVPRACMEFPGLRTRSAAAPRGPKPLTARGGCCSDSNLPYHKVSCRPLCTESSMTRARILPSMLAPSRPIQGRSARRASPTSRENGRTACIAARFLPQEDVVRTDVEVPRRWNRSLTCRVAPELG